jgi:hypothetical protein
MIVSFIDLFHYIFIYFESHRNTITIKMNKDPMNNLLTNFCFQEMIFSIITFIKLKKISCLKKFFMNLH